MLAHSSSQSSMQTTGVSAVSTGAPAAVAPCSPQLQIRSIACAQTPVKEPVIIRAVATPLRAEEMSEWSVSRAVRLCGEGEEAHFIGKMRVLERHVAASVTEAVDGLNRRLIWCPEDGCVFHSPGEHAYHLLYRSGRWEAVCAQLGLATRGRMDGRSGSSNPVAMVANPPHAEVSRQSSWAGLEKIPPVPSGGATPSTAAATAVQAAMSSARKGKPPLRTGTARAPSARGEDTSSVNSVPAVAAYPRYASPAARVVQQANPTQGTASSWSVVPGTAAPVISGQRVHSGAATPTAPPPPAMCSGASSSELSARRAATPAAPPPTVPLLAHASQVGPQISAVPPAVVSHQVAVADAPAVQVVAEADPPQHAKAVVCHPAAGSGSAPRRLSTPREALERDLTEPEKVKFGDLDFIESLGSGEFGQVFRGTYYGIEVAIKQLYWDDTMTELVMQDLAKEIESFRHLRHKRLVRFIGACLEMPHPCLVTEYMPGGSLHHLLHVRKLQLPLLHALNMCLQVADGVMYLHAQTPTVVHRDLKSLNVVLDLSLNIKICDFGLTEPMERTHITKKNNGGSPRYMAPELFDSKTKITEKIDVWAMGCIFVEICGGPLPYETISTLADLTREMLVHRRTPDVPNIIPEEVRQVICLCLSFDYRMRPSCKGAFEQLQAAKKQLRKVGVLQ